MLLFAMNHVSYRRLLPFKPWGQPSEQHGDDLSPRRWTTRETSVKGVQAHRNFKHTLTPLPLGRLIHGFSLPMMKTLFSRVANSLSIASLTWTMLKPPSCRSRCVMTPTRPILRPPVTMAITPVSKLMKSVTLPVAMSILTVSLTLIAGSGYRILRFHQYV
jgi:hypothetical protein